MRALQLIYSFFLGLAVAGFVGVGLDTFYPRPDFPPLPIGAEKDPAQVEAYQAQSPVREAAYATWNLNSSIILLIAATALLVIGLVLAERWVVLANGLLLGGLFTMVYAVGRSASEHNLTRFLVIAAALLVTIVVGWFRFARRRPEAATAGATDSGTSPGDAGLERRVSELEERLAALRRALDT